MAASCSGCGGRWAGHMATHCSMCHETFSTVSNFDLHLRGVVRGRRVLEEGCCDPVSVGLEVGHRGYWQKPGVGKHAARFGRIKRPR